MKKIKDFILAFIFSVVVCFLLDQVFDISKPKSEEEQGSKQSIMIEGVVMDDGRPAPIHLKVKGIN